MRGRRESRTGRSRPLARCRTARKRFRRTETLRSFFWRHRPAPADIDRGPERRRGSPARTHWFRRRRMRTGRRSSAKGVPQSARGLQAKECRASRAVLRPVSRSCAPCRLRRKGGVEALKKARPYFRIDQPLRTLAPENRDQLLGRHFGELVARLMRDACSVRARDHVIQRQQRMVGRRWLFLPDIEPGACQPARRQGREQGVLVVDAAARRRTR